MWLERENVITTFYYQLLDMIANMIVSAIAIITLAITFAKLDIKIIRISSFCESLTIQSTVKLYI